MQRTNASASAGADRRKNRSGGVAGFSTFEHKCFHPDSLPAEDSEGEPGYTFVARAAEQTYPVALNERSVTYNLAMRILCADALDNDLLEPLRTGGHDVVVEPSLTGETLPEALADNPADIVVVRSTKVTEDAIIASSRLGLIVRAGAGTDNIDKEAASNRGVYVANVPGQNAIAVAELAMGLLLSIDRNIPAGVADLAEGKWDKARYSKADGVFSKTLAIIGLGEIGLALAERARAFGMRVTALAKPGRTAATLTRLDAAGIELVDSLDELLGGADVVSLHVPKSEETTGMVDADFLAKMAPGSILLNTSRGEVVDGAALLTAMDDRGIRAGLDVWPDEPRTSNEDWESDLSSHPNVVGTHHIGASTGQAQAAIAAGTVEVIEAYLGGRVINCVNLVSEPAGGFVLTVRHLDKVGVLAKIFSSLRGAGLNVKQMENQLFTGSVAAVASIQLEHEPEDDLIRQLETDDDVLAVSLAPAAR